jgi:cephalosporin hydroxylase
MTELIAPGGRSFSRSRSAAELDFIANGAFKLRYRRIHMLKSPLDIAIYMHLISELRPMTVIEIGSHRGASALWFADMIRMNGEQARVVSIDLEIPPRAKDPRVTFLQGDATKLQEALSDDLLATLPHPWLVTEDSAHLYDTTRGVLEFFHPRLRAGDYVVVEDGDVGDLDKPFRIAPGPNEAVHELLTKHPGQYEIDAELCDFFGYNVTSNPNGYLRRIA